MSSITDLLAAILAAKKGEEVRGSIHDAIELCYQDGKAGVNDLQARQLIEAVAAVNEEQAAALEALQARVEELESGEGGSSQQSTTIDIPTVLVDGGVVENVSVNNNSTTTRHIAFTTEFTETPKVMVAIGKNVGAVSQYGYLSANILYPTVTTTGFDFFLANRTGSDRSPGVVWYAYQPTVKTVDLDITIPETEGMTEAEVREITGPIAAAVDALKTGYDGTSYQTAAEAVRTQINDLHVLIGDEPGTAISASAVGYNDSNVADELTGLNGRLDGLSDVSVVNGQLVIDGIAYDLGGVGIASISKTGTSGLVDTYTIVLTDGSHTTFTVTNGDASDAKIQGFIEDWLEEHPEATTTVQDGAITLAKLAPEVTQKLSDVKLNYKWYAAGYMRANVRTFQGWTQNVVWEPDLGKAVGIVISSNTAHEYANPWYRVTIDPSGYMSEYEAVVLYDTDGTTEYTSTAYYMGSLCRLSDGRYMAIDSGHDIYISSDYCKTFVRQQTYAFDGAGSMFGLRQLSNGRLIVGFGGNRNGFYYSDDVGQTWTFTSANNSGLGQQAYPSGAFKPFEPCFIDCGNGKVACFARKSTGAYTSGGTLAECVYKHLEPAVYSVSTDYGATWTDWVDSQTITDMTAGNAKYCIIDGTVHMVFASRFTHVDGNLRIFYTYASIDDAYADNWATPVQIEEGHWDEETAHDAHDGGYPSVWTDGIGNLFAVYYDGDGSGTNAGANWRLLEGSPCIKAPAITNIGSGSLNVGYSQSVIDAKIAKLRGYINDLYTKVGELPDDPDEYDGSSLIMSGLAAWFRPGTSDDWDNYTLSNVVDNNNGAVGCRLNSGFQGSFNQAPTAFTNGYSNVSSIHGTSILSDIGVTGVFTVEVLSYSTSDDRVFALRSALASGANANTIYQRNRKFGTSRKGTYHFVGVFTSGSIDWYINGQFVTTETTEVTLVSMLAAYPLFPVNNNYGYVNDCRIYSKALTADEIRNNYLYMYANVDFDTVPVFS